MYIERVQIEEGFLDGLDVQFVEGLNVIIGERGTGKTSLIELIRYCLGVKGYTTETAKRSHEHALSVLGAGQVTVTLSDGQRSITVSRTSNDESPRAGGPFIVPILFSQTEIESVGLQANARLRLIDSFLDDKRRTKSDDASTISEVRSLTAEANALRREVEEIDQKLQQIPIIDKQLVDLAPAEQQLGKTSLEAADKKKKLDLLSVEISKSAVAAAAIERFRQRIYQWRSALNAAATSPSSSETWPGGGKDPLAPARSRFEAVQLRVKQALDELEQIEIEVQKIASTVGTSKMAFEEQARELRKAVEVLQSGAGAIVRQAQQLREQRAQLVSLQAVVEERRRNLSKVVKQRGSSLDRLDRERQERSQARSAAILELNSAIGPRIRIALTRAGQFDSYTAAITDALKGSGLRYNDLSSALAKAISPRELLEACDTNNFDSIADAASITRDRAARVLAHLREADMSAIATTPIDDVVTFQLLDGKDYKDIGELSTGQRCTVILPIILRHIERILVVDQPEDHIDNAFIVDTLIQAILARSPTTQIIFTTHNANIPVLGNAERVLQLGSNGRRGYILAAASLDEPVVVSAISTVMEGGAEAFEQRAKFYRGHKKP
jgi:ABC-type lipoprotein export system ATPase subunit